MDKSTFCNKIFEHSDCLYRLAKSIMLDEELAKDCVQDLYLKLWEQRNNLENIENMLYFAMKILRNICLDKLRKQKKFDVFFDDFWNKQYEFSLQEFIENKDITLIIKQLIDLLPEHQKTIIRMRDVEGFEIKEIAYIMSSNENAVMVNLSRARQKIRENLIKIGINKTKN